MLAKPFSAPGRYTEIFHPGTISHLFNCGVFPIPLHLNSWYMKKLRPPYLIVALMLVLFAGIIILPCITGRAKEQSRYSLDKEKTEKENREKDSTGENEYKEYLSDAGLLNQNRDCFPVALIKYVDQGSLFLQALYLPVLTPPPDRA